MYGSKEIVSIIFRFLNFAAFIALIVYLFKNYALDQIKEKIAEKFALFKGLETQRKDLINQNQVAKKEIEDQDDLFALLQKKIKTWNNSCRQATKEKNEELASIKEYHKVRLEQQSANIKQQRLLKKVLPGVITNTYQQLEQKFSKKEESQKFLKDIIGYMKKSTENYE